MTSLARYSDQGNVYIKASIFFVMFKDAQMIGYPVGPCHVVASMLVEKTSIPRYRMLATSVLYRQCIDTPRHFLFGCDTSILEGIASLQAHTLPFLQSSRPHALDRLYPPTPGAAILSS